MGSENLPFSNWPLLLRGQPPLAAASSLMAWHRIICWCSEQFILIPKLGNDARASRGGMAPKRLVVVNKRGVKSEISMKITYLGDSEGGSNMGNLQSGRTGFRAWDHCLLIVGSWDWGSVSSPLKWSGESYLTSQGWGVGSMRQNAAAAAAKWLQLCLTLRDPMDCSLPGSSIRGIFRATVLEWGAIAFSHETV